MISADEDNGLPPLVLAAGGLVVGTVALGLLGLTGLLSMRAATASTAYADRTVPGGSRSSSSAWSPPRWPTRPGSAPDAGSGLGWRRSWRCSRCWRRWPSPGCSWASCRGPSSSLGLLLVLAGVLAVKLGERAAVRPEPVGT